MHAKLSKDFFQDGGLVSESFQDAIKRGLKKDPPFNPMLKVRVSCDRTHQVLEFSVPSPLGEKETVVEAAMDKLLVVLRKLGLTSEDNLTLGEKHEGSQESDKESSEEDGEGQGEG